MKLQGIKGVKTTICGIQGSGKTYFTKRLIKQFKNPLVYGVHSYEWEKENVNLFIPKDYKLSTFNEFCKNLIFGLKTEKKNYDCLIIDEADLFFQSNFQIYEDINNLFINHRHYPQGKGIALILITRRPQDIPAKVFESSEHLFIFAVDGENVKRKLRVIHYDIEDLIKRLSKDKHNFIYKRLGEAPKLIKKVEDKK